MSSSSDITIERQAYPWGRAYVVKGVEGSPLILPSVTTILKLIVNPKYEELKKEFGEERWFKIMSDAADRGTVMHTMLEIFILEWSISKDPERALKKAQIYAINEAKDANNEYKKIVEKGRNLFWNFYHDNFWDVIEEVVANELFMYTTFKGGWAGATDFVFRDKNGDLVVEDFKSSTSPKDEEDILGYKLQISGYMFMVAEKFGEVPKMGRIRISNEENSDLQTFIVHDYELKDYLKQFVDLSKKFRELNNIK